MLKTNCNQPDFKTYKELAEESNSFETYASGEQLPLFDIPSVKVSPAISKGLPKLRDLLLAEGIQIKSFDELYTAAVNILKFVANKERRVIVINPEEA